MTAVFSLRLLLPIAKSDEGVKSKLSALNNVPDCMVKLADEPTENTCAPANCANKKILIRDIVYFLIMAIGF